MSDITQHDKAAAFKALHEDGTFIIPNFWDTGSAVVLERLGFTALASTSAGFAQTIGQLDGTIDLDTKIAHCQAAAAATDIPISVDFENGFADQPDEVAKNLLQLVKTGVVGASIEDFSGSQIYDHTLAVERVAACSEALAGLDFPFMLTARAENLIRGVQDLDDTIARLVAFSEAGAQVLYAPGLSSTEQIQAVLDAVNKPINVLCPFMPTEPLSTYESLGVRRLSLGSALANYALGATLNAAGQMLDSGDFSWLMNAAPGKVIKNLFS